MADNNLFRNPRVSVLPTVYNDIANKYGKLILGPVKTRDDGHSTYGFGRRACVGKHAANDSLFFVRWDAWLRSYGQRQGNPGSVLSAIPCFPTLCHSFLCIASGPCSSWSCTLLNTDPLSPLILSLGVIKLGPYGLTHAVIRHFIFDMATVLWAAQL